MTNPRYRYLLNIDMVLMGVKGDYIKVIPSHHSNNKYIPSCEFNDNTRVDTNYYINSMNTALQSGTKALGMVSYDTIITGQFSLQ